MTIGIYSLYWEEQDLIYIGQSQNIENRFKAHLYLLKNNKHYNYKIQIAYNSYGLPKLIIVEECNINSLNEKEENLINSLDNVKKLNISSGPLNLLRGENHNNSKYTTVQIYLVFRLLYGTTLTYKEIKSITGVHVSTISNICNSNSYNWLEDKFPILYSRMISNRSTDLRFKRNKNLKASYITKEMLNELIPKHSWISLGKLLGFSDSGIRQRAKSLGCNIPIRNTRKTN